MYTSILFQAALLSVAQAHGVILAAQGLKGSPTSVGFKVDDAIARNCTGISPCQQDTTIIRDAEIAANIVNECGRTELSGNIDVGENTENALAANSVTQVKAGTKMTVTIHQVNADGAGPYSCDLDQTSNAAKTQDFNITVQLPDDLACTGASTGNVCTIRCRNNAVAGPFGGCFAVQQTDIAASNNSAKTITTAQTLKAIEAQVQENNVDLPAAIAANQAAGSAEGIKGFDGANALLSASVVSKAAAVVTPAVENVGAGAAATVTPTPSSSSPAKAKATPASKGSGRGNPNANSNAAKGNRNGNGRNNNNNNNNKARGSRLKWASRLFASDSWEEPSN
ncbi:hypothetical protein EYC84_003477 [Monilinia fructicola]|uniref:Gas1-like protein n=1 Tax=Monilinia fructicola TaxID=38448 RepID=A0A5M9JYF8_MONFR|nr:hypothetical protein EYC84_003477 [Monilinia fructicola]